MQNTSERIICTKKNLESEKIAMKSIVTITLNPSVDQSCTTSVVTDEKKLQCHHPQYDPGGGGINVSRVIKRLDGETKAFYPAGKFSGDLLEQLLDREELDHVRIHVQEPTRINFHVIEDSTDKQFRFNLPGTGMKEGELKDLLHDLKEFTPTPDLVVVSGSIPPDLPPSCLHAIAEIVDSINAKLIVDTSGDGLHHALEYGLYLMKPNLREFAELIGKPIKNQDQIIAEATKIIEEKNVSIIIVSMGQAGTVYVSSEEQGVIQTPFVPIKSRIGAGDSMVAGITLQLALNKSLETAVTYGVAAGTAAVMTPGTKL